ncbi:hypothetical protein AAC387_Pa04g2686 [Persea americana]
MLPQCMLQKALAFPTPSLLFGSGPSAKRVALNTATHMGDHLDRQIIENQRSDFRDRAPDMSVSAGAEGSGNEGGPTNEEGKKKGRFNRRRGRFERTRSVTGPSQVNWPRSTARIVPWPYEAGHATC